MMLSSAMADGFLENSVFQKSGISESIASKMVHQRWDIYLFCLATSSAIWPSDRKFTQRTAARHFFPWFVIQILREEMEGSAQPDIRTVR